MGVGGVGGAGGGRRREGEIKKRKDLNGHLQSTTKHTCKSLISKTDKTQNTHHKQMFTKSHGNKNKQFLPSVFRSEFPALTPGKFSSWLCLKRKIHSIIFMMGPVVFFLPS